METASSGHIKPDEGTQGSAGDGPDSQQSMQQMTMSPQSLGGASSIQSHQQAPSSTAQSDAQPSTTTSGVNQHGGQHQQLYQQVGGGHQGNRNSHSYHNNQNPPSHLHPQQQHRHLNKYINPNRNDSEFINHILLVTVINPHYHFNCVLVHQIFSNYGKVQRIVIFKKNGVQAMVEFDSVESAKRAKTSLNGYELFNNCCTLRIEYAKPTKLNVHRNDNDSYDYTNPNLPSSGPNIGHFTQSGDPNMQHSLGIRQMHPRQPVHHHHGRLSRVGGSDRAQSRDHLQQQGPHHFHQSNPNSIQPGGPAHHHHVQPGVSGQHSSGHQQHGPGGVGQGGYGIVGNPVDHSGDAGGPFAQDGKYNMSRPAPSQYVDPVDGSPYMQAHGGPHPHHHDATLYHRQYSHQQNPHQGRSGGRGDNYGSDGNGNGGPGHNYLPPQNQAGSNTSVLGVSGMGPTHGTVMMVYGLQLERVSCDRLFNLFCLYGNVVRVKFLRTKEGCAMVQMGDVLAVDRCVSSLNKSMLFGNEVQISYSKQAFLHDVMQPFILPDGSLSFKDFMGNKNNRFKNPEVAIKNRISPPSPVLHFFNAPYGISEEELVHLFKQNSGHEPVSVNIFPPKENSKSYSGLINFKDSIEATESLVVCNHITMPKPGAPHPHVLRLCFSQSGQGRTHQNLNQAQSPQQQAQ